ncbi:homoprotocatechuate degradation operon regulator HpaR [Thorsellia kenyensis]|uniref:Homoprotocatechuate degradation operon regulator HpaR n=1 Tax=Thorsellia kenyensis TaxID=1549888 RepID=A0ABV6CBZ3_9GAMM
MRQSLTLALLQARETAMLFFRPILHKYNLTEQQWRIMRVLFNLRSVDFDELSKKTCILKPSLTGILNRMERDELIFKLKPLNDQRKLFIALTEKGQFISKHVHYEIELGYKKIESSFSLEKLNALQALIEEFNALSSSTELLELNTQPIAEKQNSSTS